VRRINPILHQVEKPEVKKGARLNQRNTVREEKNTQEKTNRTGWDTVFSNTPAEMGLN